MSDPIQIRSYHPDDYPMVFSWWDAHGWDAVPEPILPKFGVVAHRSGNAIAAAWLYMDNSVGVSMMEWMVANPESSARDVVAAIREIIEFLKQAAIKMDYGVMLTTCKQESLASLYERNGFQRTDSSMIHLLRVLR